MEIEEVKALEDIFQISQSHNAKFVEKLVT